MGKENFRADMREKSSSFCTHTQWVMWFDSSAEIFIVKDGVALSRFRLSERLLAIFKFSTPQTFPELWRNVLSIYVVALKKRTRFLLLTFCCSVLQFSAFSLWSFGRKVFSRRAPAIARGWKFKDQRKIFGVFIHKFCAFRPVAFDFLASFPKFWWNFSPRQCQNAVEKLRAKSQQNVVHPPSKFGIHRKNEKMFHESRFFLWLSARRWEPQHLPFSCFVSCALEAFFFLNECFASISSDIFQWVILVFESWKILWNR